MTGVVVAAGVVQLGRRAAIQQLPATAAAPSFIPAGSAEAACAEAANAEACESTARLGRHWSPCDSEGGPERTALLVRKPEDVVASRFIERVAARDQSEKPAPQRQ